MSPLLDSANPSTPRPVLVTLIECKNHAYQALIEFNVPNLLGYMADGNPRLTRDKDERGIKKVLPEGASLLFLLYTYGIYDFPFTTTFMGSTCCEGKVICWMYQIPALLLWIFILLNLQIRVTIDLFFRAKIRKTF